MKYLNMSFKKRSLTLLQGCKGTDKKRPEEMTVNEEEGVGISLRAKL